MFRTPAQLGGDFSAIGIVPGSVRPLAPVAEPATILCLPIDPNTGAPFPGNIIPATDFSRIAQVAKAGRTVSPRRIASAAAVATSLTTTLPNTVNQQTYKLDQQLWAFRVGLFPLHQLRPTRMTTSMVQSPSRSESASSMKKSESWMISHTIPPAATIIVNNFRFGRLEATCKSRAAIPPPRLT